MKVVWMYHDIMDLYGDKGKYDGSNEALFRSWYSF